MDVHRLDSTSVQISQRAPEAKEFTPSTSTSVEGAQETPKTIGFTRAEKEYFAEAFPSAGKEIRQHVLYQKNGVQRSSSLGTVVDRKG